MSLERLMMVAAYYGASTSPLLAVAQWEKTIQQRSSSRWIPAEAIYKPFAGAISMIEAGPRR